MPHRDTAGVRCRNREISFRGEVIGIVRNHSVVNATAKPEEESDKVVSFREPRSEDGATISALIAACPPLDANSAYCNLLQCTHFAPTCVVAEQGGTIVGWISAYRPPSAPQHIFVWQVAVASSARGTGLATRMLEALLRRSAVSGATALITTITADNAPSWALFAGFARKHDLRFTRTKLFERDAHFGGAHDTEWQAEISPLPDSVTQSTKDNT